MKSKTFKVVLLLLSIEVLLELLSTGALTSFFEFGSQFVFVQFLCFAEQLRLLHKLGLLGVGLCFGW